MKHRGPLFIVVGVAIGVGLILYGLASTRRRTSPTASVASARANLTTAVTASRAIARGQTIEQADLSSVVLYNGAPTGLLRSPGDAVGHVATADIPAHQFILGEHVSTDPAAGGLALHIPGGRRAISLVTTEEIAVSGLIRAGDHVDIQTVLRDDVVTKGAAAHAGGDASEARTVLHDIVVLAIDGGMSDPANAKSQNGQLSPQRHQSTLTVAMTPEQVSRFTLARSLGPYFLALRNPKDNGASFTENRAQLIDIRSEAMASPRDALTSSIRRVGVKSRAPIELVVEGHAQALYPGAGQ